MLCPKCHRETSDTANTCVWCGATLDWSRYDPAAAIREKKPSQSAPAGQPPPPGDYASPGDAGPQVQGPAAPVSQWQAAGTGPHPSPPRERRWYLTPWPYLAALLITVAVVSVLLIRDNGAGAFPELVVEGKPTLLNVYTDT